MDLKDLECIEEYLTISIVQIDHSRNKMWTHSFSMDNWGYIQIGLNDFECIGLFLTISVALIEGRILLSPI